MQVCVSLRCGKVGGRKGKVRGVTINDKLPKFTRPLLIQAAKVRLCAGRVYINPTERQIQRQTHWHQDHIDTHAAPAPHAKAEKAPHSLCTAKEIFTIVCSLFFRLQLDYHHDHAATPRTGLKTSSWPKQQTLMPWISSKDSFFLTVYLIYRVGWWWWGWRLKWWCDWMAIELICLTLSIWSVEGGGRLGLNWTTTVRQLMAVNINLIISPALTSQKWDHFLSLSKPKLLP